MGRIPAGVGNKIALTVKNTYGANAAMTLFQPPASLGVPSTGIVISKPGLYAFNAFGSNTGFRNIFTISSGGTATGYLFNNAAVTAAMTAFNLSSSTTATFILTTAANQLLCLIVKTLAGTITTSGRSAT